jgi:hypothetical protein
MGYRLIPNKTKLKAAALYAEIGVFSQVAELLGVTPQTISTRWAVEPWWQEAVEKWRKDYDEASKARLRKITEKADNAVLERLEHGDVRLGRDGSPIPVPVSARDAAVISAISRDKLRAAEGKPTHISVDLTKLLELRGKLTQRESATTLEGECVAITDSLAIEKKSTS